MGGYFITASGTDAGKTLLTAALAWQLRAQGKAVLAVKPMLSGFDPADLAQSDAGQLLAALGRPVTLAEADAIAPWRFAAPVSPHLAARQEGAAVTAEDITDFCRRALAHEGVTLIEGAGGAFSPLVQGFTQADLLQRLRIPALVLGGTYLGGISHLLATAEALLARDVPIAALVLCESAQGGASLEDTRAAVAAHLPVALPLFTLPRISPKTEAPLWQQLPALTRIIEHG